MSRNNEMNQALEALGRAIAGVRAAFESGLPMDAGQEAWYAYLMGKVDELPRFCKIPQAPADESFYTDVDARANACSNTTRFFPV